MLVPNQQVEMCWNNRNKSRYISLGYEYTGRYTMFLVKVEDLLDTSKKKVKVICDNCGKEMIRPYREYIKYHDNTFGDLCTKCCTRKRESTCMKKYGNKNPSQVEIFKEKRTNTHLKLYGVENAFQSDVFKNKSKQTCLEKYGTEYANQCENIKSKIRNTCIIKYGGTNPNKSEKVREKINNTLLRHGNIKTSNAQFEMYNILDDMYSNVTLNYIVGRCTLDCMVEIKSQHIDIEYDGQYWHQQRENEDRRRDFYLMRRGYKVLRIKANNDVPSREQLKQGIDYLVNGNHYHKIIELDI